MENKHEAPAAPPEVQKEEEGSPPVRSRADTLIEQKHRHIAARASRILMEKGYHPTTIREIAKECGMSMGQIYHYISSKDDVLYLVFQDFTRIWLEHMQESDIGNVKDPVERLRKALYHNLRFAVAHKRLIQFLFTESKYLDPKHLQAFKEMDSHFIFSYWRNMLSEMERFKHSESDIDLVASVIEYLVTFLPLRGWSLPDGAIEDKINSLISFILRGIGVPPE